MSRINYNFRSITYVSPLWNDLPRDFFLTYLLPRRGEFSPRFLSSALLDFMIKLVTYENLLWLYLVVEKLGGKEENGKILAEECDWNQVAAARHPTASSQVDCQQVDLYGNSI